MWSRWISLVVLGVMSLGPVVAWSAGPGRPKADSLQGWASTPLPEQTLEAKSKFNTFSLGFAVATQPPMLHVAGSLFPKPKLNYAAPILGRPLFLFYSKLQSDGG